MKVFLINSDNGRKEFNAKEVEYDENLIWCVGYWEGTNGDNTKNIVRIGIPYNNLFHLLDETYNVDGNVDRGDELKRAEVIEIKDEDAFNENIIRRDKYFDKEMRG